MQGPGSGANAIVLPSTHLHAHAHALRRTSRPDHCRPKTGPGGQPDRAPEPDPGPSTQRAAAAGCLVEPTQAASSSTRPLPRRGLHPVPPTHAHFQEYCLTCPRTPCFLFLAAPGSPGRKLCHIVVSSTSLHPGESHAFCSPQARKPKAKNHLGRGTPQLVVCHALPPCHAMSPTCTLLSCQPPPGMPSHRHRGPRLDMFLSRRSDTIQGSQSVGSKWESHGKQGKQTSEHSASAAPRPRRGGTIPNIASPCPSWPASPDTSYPLPAFSTRDQQEPAPGRPGSAEELLC